MQKLDMRFTIIKIALKAPPMYVKKAGSPQQTGTACLQLRLFI